MFRKASSDGDSATSMGRLSQSSFAFTVKKKILYIKVKPLLVQLVPVAPCLQNVAPCEGRASVPSGAACPVLSAVKGSPLMEEGLLQMYLKYHFLHSSTQRVWKLIFWFEWGALFGSTLFPPLKRANAPVLKSESEGPDPESGWCCCSFCFIQNRRIVFKSLLNSKDRFEPRSLISKVLHLAALL